MRKVVLIKCIIVIAVLGLVFSLTLQGDSKKEKPGEPELLSTAQLIKQYSIYNLELSTDGNLLAMVVREPVADTKSKRNIWLYDCRDNSFRQITNVGSDGSPQWSPDGEHLAFLSRRDKEKNQIYLLPMKGGESVRLTDGKRGIQSFKWAPDGKSILFTSTQPKSEEEKKKEKEKGDAQVVSKSHKNTQLHRITIKSKEVKELFNKKELSVDSFLPVPGGKTIIFSASDPSTPEYDTAKIYSLDNASGKPKRLYKPEGPFKSLKLSKDGKTLYFVGSDQGGPEPHDLYQMPLSGGTPQNITGKSLDRYINSYYPQKDGSILAAAADGFGVRMIRIDKNGNIRDFHSIKNRSLSSFLKIGKKLVYTAYDAVTPMELYVWDQKGDRRISDFHKDFPKLVKPEIFNYKSKDGLTIEAALYKPPNPPSGKLPLLVMIHGGPAGKWSHRIDTWTQLMAARGYAVFLPNIRGSVGYGISFIRANRKDWGGKDWQDILDGVDYLIANGTADPDKMGIGGWSYGGYMSAWAVTQTNRFKVAIVGAAMTDLAVEYGAEMASINAYDTWYLGNPYENLDDFLRMSPMTFIKNAKTPALILTGENDSIDPPAQSKQFYRGLRRMGVDTELVIYPREGHGLREEKHRLDINNRVINWFEKYVNPKEE